MTTPTIFLPLDRDLRNRAGQQHTTLGGGPCIAASGFWFGSGFDNAAEIEQAVQILRSNDAASPTRRAPRRVLIGHALDPLYVIGTVTPSGTLTAEALAKQNVTGIPFSTDRIGNCIRALDKRCRALGLIFDPAMDSLHFMDEFTLGPGGTMDDPANDVYREMQRLDPKLPDFIEAAVEYYSAGVGPFGKTEQQRNTLSMLARMIQTPIVTAIRQAIKGTMFERVPITCEEMSGGITVNGWACTTVYDKAGYERGLSALRRYGARYIPIIQPQSMEWAIKLLGGTGNGERSDMEVGAMKMKPGGWNPIKCIHIFNETGKPQLPAWQAGISKIKDMAVRGVEALDLQDAIVPSGGVA